MRLKLHFPRFNDSKWSVLMFPSAHMPRMVMSTISMTRGTHVEELPSAYAASLLNQ